MTIKFDHTIGVQLTCRSVQLVDECERHGEKLEILTPRLHTKHINQLALGKGSKHGGVFESVCIPNVRTKR